MVTVREVELDILIEWKKRKIVQKSRDELAAKEGPSSAGAPYGETSFWSPACCNPGIVKG
jgi:hypothetical protein